MSVFRRFLDRFSKSQVEGEVASKRELQGLLKQICAAIAVAGALYHLYTAAYGTSSIMTLRVVHWAFLSVLVFMLYPASRRSPRNAITAADALFALAALASSAYIYFRWKAIVDNAGFTNMTDTIMGAIMVVVVLEACRRAVGMPLTVIAGIFLVYAYLGPCMPGMLAHKGYSISRIVSVLYTTTDGIYGTPIGISASYIVLFILFGAFLQASGGGKFFTDVAFALVGRSPGGPAKAAVVSSGLMGTMSGAAVANVVTTGTFTIPLMKKSGYQPHVAGAVEAVASSGGQIMPPVMGAAAFMIAEIVGVPYAKVALAGVIPALLYYIYLYYMVHVQARKWGLSGLSKEDTPDLKQAFVERGHLIIPVVVLVYFIIKGYSPAMGVFWSILFSVALAMLRKTTRMNLKSTLGALESAMTGTITVAAACAAAGIIGGVVSLTGLGLRFSSILTAWAGDSMLLGLFLTMVASLVLGCGLPTSAAYIILAVLSAPALEKLGVPPLAAHLFIFYFGCISTITPPVALSAYAGAAIAGADPMRVGWTAFKFGLISFVIPYMMIYRPRLMMIGTALEIILAALFTTIGVLALVAAVQGYAWRPCKLYERLAFLAASALLLLFPLHVGVTGLGLALVAVAAVPQMAAERRRTQCAAAGN
ncbi:MAG: TRAP transporter permease [Firmicutes bacterium]|nr:TRAP transporter permease [Bacillota bacterium]